MLDEAVLALVSPETVSLVRCLEYYFHLQYVLVRNFEPSSTFTSTLIDLCFLTACKALAMISVEGRRNLDMEILTVEHTTLHDHSSSQRQMLRNGLFAQLVAVGQNL